MMAKAMAMAMLRSAEAQVHGLWASHPYDGGMGGEMTRFNAAAPGT